MLSNECVRLRHARSWATLMANISSLRNCGVVMEMATRRWGSGKSSGRSRTPFTIEKIAVLAPMPMARLRMAMAAKPRSFQSVRRAYFMYEGLRPIRKYESAVPSFAKYYRGRGKRLRRRLRLWHALGDELDGLPDSLDLHVELDGIGVGHLALVVHLGVAAAHAHRDMERNVVPVDRAVFDSRLAEPVAVGFAGELVAVHLKDESPCDGAVGRLGSTFPVAADVRGRGGQSEKRHQDDEPFHGIIPPFYRHARTKS